MKQIWPLFVTTLFISSTVWASDVHFFCTVRGVLKSGQINISSPIKTGEVSLIAVRSQDSLKKVTLRESLAVALTDQKRFRFKEAFAEKDMLIGSILEVPYSLYEGPDLNNAGVVLALADDLSNSSGEEINGELLVSNTQGALVIGELSVSLSCREDKSTPPIEFF